MSEDDRKIYEDFLSTIGKPYIAFVDPESGDDLGTVSSLLAQQGKNVMNMNIKSIRECSLFSKNPMKFDFLSNFSQ